MQQAAHGKVSRAGARIASGMAGLGLAVALLGGGLLGCGGSDGGTIPTLPPGGIGVGELLCFVTAPSPGDTVVQGSVVTVQFRLIDANQQVPASGIPVSFEVAGGTIPDPPQETDLDGRVGLQFVTDSTYEGQGLVRLIQPDANLDCEVTFRIVEASCSLTASILDETGATLVDDACGGLPEAFTRDVDRTVRFTIMRPDPDTGNPEPVEGLFVQVTVSGQTNGQLTVGPSDANGRIAVLVSEAGGDVVPDPVTVGELFVEAEVLIPDGNGDTLPDALPCNLCNVTLDISDTPCDQDGDVLAVEYFEADGDVRGMDRLRPGEYATVTISLTRNGTPLVDEEVLAFADNGTLDDSATPVTVTTDGSGMATVTYRPTLGFGGTGPAPEVDTIHFRALSGALECDFTAEVNVVTCGLELEFTPSPALAGRESTVRMTVLYVDPDTAAGQRVAIGATGGYTSPPGPLIAELATDGVSVWTDVLFTPNPVSASGSLSLTFIDGYACETLTERFDIARGVLVNSFQIDVDYPDDLAPEPPPSPAGCEGQPDCAIVPIGPIATPQGYFLGNPADGGSQASVALAGDAGTGFALPAAVFQMRFGIIGATPTLGDFLVTRCQLLDPDNQLVTANDCVLENLVVGGVMATVDVAIQ